MTDAPSPPSRPRLGVDTGGTFTDVVMRDRQGRLRVHKLLSTPSDPSEAIAAGVDELATGELVELVHGTTVATNALLERRGARCALVTTAGFEDLLWLARQHRPSLYALHIERTPPLIGSPSDCYGVEERVLCDGHIACALERAAIDRLLEALRQATPSYQAVAICLLHSYANPEHEARLAEAIRQALPAVFVTASSELVRELREYERASTTTINAYVGPVMARYLDRLAERVEADPLEIFESSGARAPLARAAREPVHTALSGPAGGVIGALAAAREVGLARIITFDMGGTSSDVSLCDGEPTLRPVAELGELPLLVPTLDIHTVGAGGGSIAHVDAGGALRVGPRSAGADPGPACYGRGGAAPTVTDAHVVLGRLRPEAFLGGQMELDADAARAAIEELADRLEMQPRALARGILDVADAAMMRAIKVISLERGHDPREFTLVAFGGAGGLHACRLARALDISRVLVPLHPGLRSAHGMLHAPRTRHLAQTHIAPLAHLLSQAGRAELGALLARLEARAEEVAPAPTGAVERRLRAELRYQGQSFTLAIPVGWSPDQDELEDPHAAFEARHEELYGWIAPGRPVELVTLRLEITESDTAEPPQAAPRSDPRGEEPTPKHRVQLGFAEEDRRAPVWARQSLSEGTRLEGPCVITEYSGTTVVPPGWALRVQAGHLLLTFSQDR